MHEDESHERGYPNAVDMDRAAARNLLRGSVHSIRNSNAAR
jgi:hypothetical protein